MKTVIRVLRDFGSWLLCASIGVGIGVMIRGMSREKKKKSFENPNYRLPRYKEK